MTPAQQMALDLLRATGKAALSRQTAERVRVYEVWQPTINARVGRWLLANGYARPIASQRHLGNAVYMVEPTQKTYHQAARALTDRRAVFPDSGDSD